MKNLLMAGLLGGLVSLGSCTANNGGAFSKGKEAQAQRVEFLKLKGDWEITSVDYNKNYRVKPFDSGADAQCFVGSHWKLTPNNYTGSYTLAGGGACPTITQPISFEVVNGTEFKFKHLAEGTKAKSVTSGYSLNLVSQTDNNFVLEQNIPSNGEIVKVSYNFQKIATK